MRNSKKYLLVLFLVCSSGFLFGQEEQEQEKLNIYATAGFPEAINVGARYQLGQKQLGAGFMVIPNSDGGFVSVSGDFFYHFGGTSKLSARHPWYFRTGLNYIYGESEYEISEWLFMNMRIGRDFNISRKIGIAFDLGFAFTLLHEEQVKKKREGWDLELLEDVSVWPGLGITLFYRL